MGEQPGCEYGHLHKQRTDQFEITMEKEIVDVNKKVADMVDNTNRFIGSLDTKVNLLIAALLGETSLITLLIAYKEIVK